MTSNIRSTGEVRKESDKHLREYRRSERSDKLERLLLAIRTNASQGKRHCSHHRLQPHERTPKWFTTSQRPLRLN